MNGLSVRFRDKSLIFSQSVGAGCGHFTASFSQLVHELDVWLYRLRPLYSSVTATGDTQPRSHCKEFMASSNRPREMSQIGVSGTCNIRTVYHITIYHLQTRFI